MKFAYADPPYLGCCSKYDHFHGESGLCWDDTNTHRLLIADLEHNFPDGWALSLSSTSLHEILPLCSGDVRVGAWVKPFAIFKPNVNPAYAWEPVIFCGGRERTREQFTVRDWISCNITLKKGLVGAKPAKVCYWVFQVLGAEPGDEFVDLFPGTGIVGESWDEFIADSSLREERLP